MTHANLYAHWLPQAYEKSPITACGRNVDGPCDNHAVSPLMEVCPFGPAWTRSRDLDEFADEPYGPKLAVCAACDQAAKAS